MRQRGRKSAASLVALTGAQPRLNPPPNLTTAERALFTEIVNACAPTAFVKSDVLLLVSLVQTTLTLRRAAAGMNADPDLFPVFEKSVKLQGMLATRLRLAPQSRMNSRAAGRKEEFAHQKPWLPEGDDDDA